MRKVILITLVFSLFIGCAMARHREQIRNGLLTTRLNREAFLKEWGMPDRTSVMTSEEVMKAGFIGSSGGFFKGRLPLDVWVYEKRYVTLVFHGLRLIGWKTDKTVRELQSPQK